MSISSNLTYFNGKPVVDFNTKSGIESTTQVYRIRTDYDKEDGPIEDLIDTFCAHPKAAEVTELVIGIWDFEGDSSASTIAKLLENKDKLPNLQYLMFGDITYEENEMSWIEQGDMTPLLNAFPKLQRFQVRGGNGLGFSNLSHKNLTSLIVETGGLSSSAVKQILAADLPNLEHLELWLGVEDYGFDGSVADYKELLDGKLFPKLKYLGLSNSGIVDDIAVALKGAPILERISVLDLSKGTMTDVGGQALLDNPALKKLDFINCYHHFMTDGMMEKLQAAFPEKIDVSGKEDSDDDWRFVEVSE